jgi:topoisomerase IA-like protein
MEEELDEIADWKQSRTPFLDSFWNGKTGFHQLLEDLKKNIDFNEIEQYTRIDLHNGYSVRFSKFGTHIQDDNGEPNEKGYRPSARIDDDADLWEYRDPDVCKELIANSVNAVGPRVLGVLDSGEYAGWTVTARSGRFGDFLQAAHPEHVKLMDEGKKAKATTPKPVNHAIPEGLELDAVELKDVAGLFAEVKLPRTLSPQLFTGVGKRGPWLGWKSTPKSRRATFISLPEGMDPRTITADEAQQVWDEKQQAKRDAEKKKAERASAKRK